MTEPIKPALTAEEWEAKRVTPREPSQNEKLFDDEWDIGVRLDPENNTLLWDHVSEGCERTIELGPRQAIAALALYNEPFGFTREDVRILRFAANVYEEDPFYFRDLEPTEDVDESPVPGMYRALADRIEALLPPEAL